MNTTLLLIIGVIALAGLTLLCARPASPRWEVSNIAEGTSDTGNRTYLADVAMSARYLLVRIGSTANHVNLAGTSDLALGIATDRALAVDEPINVQLLGAVRGTVLMTASAPISAGDLVVTAANGKIRTLPGTTGTYEIIGRAVEAAVGDNDIIQVVPTFPIRRVV